MNIRLKILSYTLFLLGVFLLAGISGASSKEEADAKAGAVLFRDKGCAFCHGSSGEGTKKAPSLVDIRKDKAWPPQKITAQILDGGQKMPPFRESLSDDEIAQLVVYLRAKDKPIPPPGPEGAPIPPPSN